MRDDQVGYDPDTNASHHERLNYSSSVVPAGDIISDVWGDSADPVSREFFGRLRTAATLIGDHTDLVRANVKQNADALKQAADDLANVETDAKTTMTTIGAIVDQTSADTSRSDVSQAAASSANSGEVVDAAGSGLVAGGSSSGTK